MLCEERSKLRLEDCLTRSFGELGGEKNETKCENEWTGSVTTELQEKSTELSGSGVELRTLD